ncbi:transcription initiation factor TFIID subunit 15 isoform X1 [Tanacetum coccineum]
MSFLLEWPRFLTTFGLFEFMSIVMPIAVELDLQASLLKVKFLGLLYTFDMLLCHAFLGMFLQFPDAFSGQENEVISRLLLISRETQHVLVFKLLALHWLLGFMGLVMSKRKVIKERIYATALRFYPSVFDPLAMKALKLDLIAYCSILLDMSRLDNANGHIVSDVGSSEVSVVKLFEDGLESVSVFKWFPPWSTETSVAFRTFHKLLVGASSHSDAVSSASQFLNKILKTFDVGYIVWDSSDIEYNGKLVSKGRPSKWICKDKRTGRPKIWIYRDKVTSEPKGDATVTYEDLYAAQAAVEGFNNKEFHRTITEVLMAESKNSHKVIAPLVERNLVADIAPVVGGMQEVPRWSWAAGGPMGLFGPTDWSCPIGGRAGGYKELDEEELQERKRRRREAEEDDGEMYDEFGSLKKKFCVKTQEAKIGQVLPGTGCAGWEVEELGRPPALSEPHGRNLQFGQTTRSTMANYLAKGGPSNESVYVCNLPSGTDEDMLAEFFRTIGLLKKDKRTGGPKIWIYRDKVTNEPKGDATVTYEDPYAAQAAVEWFNNKDFHGTIIEVLMAESKNSHNVIAPLVEPSLVADVVPDESGLDMSECGGMGRGRGDASGNAPPIAWQQDGDWMCPNTRSLSNVNFAFRGVCNRCGSARPAGASGGGSGGSGRGRGRGGPDSVGGRGLVVLLGRNRRGGRAGGYKELDEEELEETKRRWREAEEDDGEMYDEFGNLKKTHTRCHSSLSPILYYFIRIPPLLSPLPSQVFSLNPPSPKERPRPPVSNLQSLSLIPDSTY